MRVPTVSEYLHRNGVVIERARRDGRSLGYEERCIVLAGRAVAKAKGVTRELVNKFEMAGERDWDKVLAKIKVKAVFAFYHDPFEEIPAMASYYITESNHPALPEHGNVDAETLIKNGCKVPKTPTYDKWVRKGKKVTRS